MHPELVKAYLRMCGSSSAAVARDLGLCRSTVHYVLSGRQRSLRVARRICELTGLDPETAWPGRYPEFRLHPVGQRRHLDHLQEAA